MSQKGSTRQIRINDEILRETATIIRNELKDPRIGGMISVTKVDTTSDLKYSKVFVSVLGSDAVKSDTMDGLKSCSGFIRKELARRINLRYTPELKFILDDSLDNAFKIDSLIREANKNSSSDESGSEE